MAQMDKEARKYSIIEDCIMKTKCWSQNITLAVFLLAQVSSTYAEGSEPDESNQAYVAKAAPSGISTSNNEQPESLTPRETSSQDDKGLRGILHKRPEPKGYYFRIGAMSVEPQEDAQFLIGGAVIETDTGAGGLAAIGYHFPQSPFSLEMEYSFRRFDTDDYLDPGSGLLGDNRTDMHVFAVNLLIDKSNILGPLGIYAGGGIGFRISEFQYSSSGGSSESNIHSDGGFGQVMAGLTFSIDRSIQVYGGMRWSDGGAIENDLIRLETESVNIEFGLRFFF